MARLPHVTHEWATLREVIVGRPHYRLPAPFPPEREEVVPPSLWKRAKRFEGMTMKEAMPTAHARCQGQMDRVVRLLRARGVRVHRVPPFQRREEALLPGEPTESLLFFPRDPMLAAGSRLFELTPADPKRRRERSPLRRLLERVHPHALSGATAMPHPTPRHTREGAWAFLDGGDCLVAGNAVFVGLSPGGSNPAGAEWLSRALGPRWTVHAVPYAREFPHLDCALCLVRPGLGLYCPDVLPTGPPEPLSGWTWIEVDRKEALEGMATNGLHLDPETLLLPESAPGTAEALRMAGHRVETVLFDAVTAFGGGLRCWSQPLVRRG